MSLSLDPYLSYFSLDLISPDGGPIQIAWDDQAHWHPHVLRWPELETICRAAALRDAELPHPGWVVLLLHRFAPICEGDDLESIVATLEAAWKKLGVFTDQDITTFIERIDARDAGFRWRKVAQFGWCLEQDERQRTSKGLYTLRHPENAAFPFAQWDRVLHRAELELARVASSAGGAIVPKKLPSPACLPRVKRSLDLSIPHNDPRRPVPTAFGKLWNDTLDHVLRDLYFGRSSPSGGTSQKNEDGTYTEVESSYFLHIKGDWDEKQRLLRDLLWWGKAPATVGLREGYTHQLPLDLETAPHEAGPLVLQLARLTTVRWRTGFRYDRVPLTAAHRQTLRVILSEYDARGPDRDGWFRVALADGGQVSLCARRLDEDEDLDGVTLRIEQLTPETAALLHRLMLENGWLLLPPVIAPEARVAEQISEAWPPVRVAESAAELHGILAAGAFAWWKAADIAENEAR